MNDFSFSVPQNIIAGRGSIAKLPEVLKQMGATRAFIISGPHLAKIGTVQSCIDRLAAVGISAAAFTDTEKNPSVETVDRATAQFKESGADCIVALGGGSPISFVLHLPQTVRRGRVFAPKVHQRRHSFAPASGFFPSTVAASSKS